MSGWRVFLVLLLAVLVLFGFFFGIWVAYEVGRMQATAEVVPSNQMPERWRSLPPSDRWGWYSGRSYFSPMRWFCWPSGCGWIVFGLLFLFCMLRWLFGWPYGHWYPRHRRWGPPPDWQPDSDRKPDERPKQT